MVKLFISIVRDILFVHKTEPNTIRVAFERLSKYYQIPRFVKKRRNRIWNLKAAWFTPNGYGKSKQYYLPWRWI